ncbi:MAG: LPS export ABC transporter periplasmic protein LptC [Bacteroidota bacterium]|nr:LPS export ABC transporter periplasmic protein LptC [Bacteroidota bacterium]
MKTRFSFPFFLILLCLSLFACENDIGEVNSITAANQKALPLESSKNVEIIYSDSAVVRARLKTKQLDRYPGEKPYVEMPKGMEVVFFNEIKEQQTRLTADYGIGYDEGKGYNRMEAKRNVVVINEKGDRLNTEHLIWDAVTKKIYTEQFVKITTKDETLWGEGMIANQDFSDYEIKKIQGSLSVKDEELENETGTEKKSKKNE